MNVLAITYLNRLSDLLFILARHANRENGDVLWVPGGERGEPTVPRLGGLGSASGGSAAARSRRREPVRPRGATPAARPRARTGSRSASSGSSPARPSPRGVRQITTTWPAYSAYSSAPSGSRWPTYSGRCARQERRGPGSGEKMRNHSRESSR